jgi:BirA family biotin operon repressor/biotin-[acetyl-CoA-carboxylase] ligase
VNLYLSVILRPKLLPRHAPQITLTAAVALAETVHSFLSEAPHIKWPNDILVGGRKLAGILTEAACDAERVQYVILGVGLNVNYRRESMPEELRVRATSMADSAGEKIPRETVLARLIHHLDRCYGDLDDGGFDTLRSRWQAYFGLRDRTVRAEHGGKTVVGRAVGIEPEGGLIVEDDQGRRVTIIAGDVIPAES